MRTHDNFIRVNAMNSRAEMSSVGFTKADWESFVQACGSNRRARLFVREAALTTEHPASGNWSAAVIAEAWRLARARAGHAEAEAAAVDAARAVEETRAPAPYQAVVNREAVVDLGSKRGHMRRLLRQFG